MIASFLLAAAAIAVGTPDRGQRVAALLGEGMDEHAYYLDATS